MNKTPAGQLAGFLRKYSPEIAAQASALLKKLRARMPKAVQMVYDNYNALVIGFGPTERPSEAILSLVLYPRYVSLAFLHGAELADPKKLLKGSGRQARHIRLDGPATLDHPDVKALIARAWRASAASPGSSAAGRIIIRSVSDKQRPLRPRSLTSGS